VTTDWLDRAALAAEERLSRRRALQLAGVSALTLGPLGALFRAAPARAFDPCFPLCNQRVTTATERTAAFCLGQLALPALSPIGAAGGIGCAFGLVYAWGTAGDKCGRPNCGNPPGSPPPPPPARPTAAPPAPPPLPPQEPEHQQHNYPPCGGTCEYSCSRCATVSGGYVCCIYPPVHGKSKCCPK
jgi:hypothetical protein